MSEEPKLVLLSPDVRDWSGWGRFTRGLCLALYKKSIPFELHLPRTASIAPPLPFEAQVHQDLPLHFTSFGKRWWRLGDLWQTARTMQVQGEVIHSLTEFPYGLLAWWLASRHGLPFGFTAYGTYAIASFGHWFDRFWFRRVVREANLIVSISHYTSERLCRISGTNRSITVIHPGVDIDQFPRGTAQDKHRAREILGIDLQDKVILCVAKLKVRKGIDVLLRAFALVRQAEPCAHLLVAGAGRADPYQQLATELGVEKETQFLKRVDHEQLVRCYHACDVFALLSREDPWNNRFEGFGLVFLEANACERPVVGTRSGGVPDAVQDRHTGLLVEPEDPEGAAEAILSLLNDPVLARRMGEHGRAWAERHSWDRIVEAYLKAYRSIR